METLNELEQMINDYEKLPVPKTIVKLTSYNKIKNNITNMKTQINNLTDQFDGLVNGVNNGNNVVDTGDIDMEKLIKESDDIIQQDINLMKLEDLINTYDILNSNINKIDGYTKNNNLEIIEHE